MTRIKIQKNIKLYFSVDAIFGSRAKYQAHEMFGLTSFKLKKNGRLIIFEPYCSVILQFATILMKHEGFDFTINVWDEKNPKSDEHDLWAGNMAIPNLLFDDKKEFEKNIG